MRIRAKSETKIPVNVQIFSNLVEMRFKPINQLGTLALNTLKTQFANAKKQYIEIYDPSSMALQADRKIEDSQPRRLKYIVSLSAQHFIVGNENQIDMIGFGNIAHTYIDTDFYWSMTMKGPIQCVLVDTKRSIFLILSQATLYFFQYSVKSKQPPQQIQTLVLREGVRFVRFLKDSLLGVFYNSNYEIYNIENINLIKKKLEKNYQVDNTKKLLTIPPSIDDIINIFFQEKKQNKQSFILWCLELNFGSEQIKTRQLYRVYDVMNYVKSKLSIQNYTKQIICMSLNHQVMAIKNGYLIDTVNLRIKDDSEILKYLHPQTILHITKRNVEVYHFSIDTSVKPEKIILQSTDSIEISKYPQNAFYISVLKTHHNNFALFFEDSDKKKIQSKGVITYYFKVSQSTTVKNKIKSIFDSIGTPDLNPQSLEEKYNMALKMGLSEKQIYLQIWNRSNRSSLEDYQYILATRDYKTIKSQIQKKLKKQSMVLRQILRIQESCHEINKEKIQSAICNEENLQDFVTSHFLLKKLNLFKQINALERFSLLQSTDDPNIPSEQRQLKIDIQNYYFFKNLDMKSYLIQQINDMLINLKNNAKIIRIIIKTFKFIYRLEYKSILQQIITSTKQNLMNLLNQIPQILPYIHHDLNEQQLRQNLYDGIWGEIHPSQWQICLYPQVVQNIHNRQALAQFLNTVWFKRYWLTSHGMTTKTKQKIIEINEFNNSDHIFYFFISKLYEHSKHNKPLYYQTIQFLQQKYQLFPHHLKNKALLYQNLYIYYFNEEKNNPARLTYGQFLEWDDELLFKYFFDHEKVKKNSLLKEVKPIYEQSDANGSHLFNIGLFSYFYSDRSQISDLKFILNRINNEKAEFHQKNKGIYEVLIKSMQLKIKVGSPNSIPMDQVMIYIQNIPLDREQEQITQELSMMESIKEEAGIFDEMKIDMTVKQIMDSFQAVIYKILKYKIQSRAILKIPVWDLFKEQSLKILKQTERIKIKIYSIDNSSYTLLVYLSLIMQEESTIDKVALLLQDEQIHNFFDVDIKTIENIVLYMYKWKFSQSAKYIDNEAYLRRLLDLLPQDNQCRSYLQTQLDIGLIFSSDYQPFQYPLCQNSYSPSIKVIQNIFRVQKDEFLLNFDLQRLYSLLQKLDRAIYNQNKKKPGESINLHKLYEILIVELLQKEMYREVIDYLYKILQLPSPIKNVGIVYIALYIYKMAKEFNQQSKKCLFKIFSIYFKQPLTILKIIDFVIKTRLTGLQQTKYLRDILQKQSTRNNFCVHNPIFSKEFISHYQDPNSKKVIDFYHEFIKNKNRDFEWSSQHDLIYIFLCHSPYLLIKFLQLQKQHLHLKQVNHLIRLVIYRPIFNIKKSFEVAKRIFVSLVLISKQSSDIDLLISTLLSKSPTDDFQIPKINKLNELETKWLKISRSYAKALNKIKNAGPKEDIKEKRILKIRAVISNPNSVFQDHIEVEQDDQQAKNQINQRQLLFKKQKVGKIDFNESEQKAKFFFRTEPIKDFLQNFDKQKFDELQQLEMIKRQSAPQQLILKAKLSGKDKNYLAVRTKMIEHLYSHKVVTGSDHQDDAALRKQDEQFLDSYQKRNLQTSQTSVRSGKSIKFTNSSRNIEPEKPVPIAPNQDGQNSIQIVDHQIVGDNSIHVLKQTSGDQNEAQSQSDSFSKLKQSLLQSYNEQKIPKFQLLPMQNYLKTIEDEVFTGDVNEIRRRKQQCLRNFLLYLYSEPQQTKTVYLKLMQQIGRKFPQAGVNNFFLQAYQRTYTTHEKHGLQMNIAQLLPLSGVFIKSKDIVELYHQVEPAIIKKITDQNIFKLSKLIALGFRKSIVEQEILFNYLKNLMNEYINSAQQNSDALKQKIRCIQHKLQVQVAIDKAQQLFKELPSGEKRDFLLSSYLETLKTRGYATASRALQAKIS